METNKQTNIINLYIMFIISLLEMYLKKSFQIVCVFEKEMKEKIIRIIILAKMEIPNLDVKKKDKPSLYHDILLVND